MCVGGAVHAASASIRDGQTFNAATAAPAASVGLRQVCVSAQLCLGLDVRIASLLATLLDVPQRTGVPQEKVLLLGGVFSAVAAARAEEASVAAAASDTASVVAAAASDGGRHLWQVRYGLRSFRPSALRSYCRRAEMRSVPWLQLGQGVPAALAARHRQASISTASAAVFFSSSRGRHADSGALTGACRRVPRQVRAGSF